MLPSVSELTTAIRTACAEVARRARQVSIERHEVAGYASELTLETPLPGGCSDPALAGWDRESRAAFWLTLDAINCGSGWFPTLRKRPGMSGYFTIATAVRERFERGRAWSAAELAEIDTVELAAALGQQPEHELIGLFADSLRDLGRHVAAEHGGEFAAVARTASSPPALAELLAGWECFADRSRYQELDVPFFKRAQIAAADLARTGVIGADGIEQLTMFADNLVPHVLRLDGLLRFDPGLVARIEREELIEHGSPEEVEIRACAVHTVELIAAARPGSCAAEIDQALWNRGAQPRYKASPRHRCRCTAY